MVINHKITYSSVLTWIRDRSRDIIKNWKVKMEFSPDKKNILNTTKKKKCKP